MVVEEAAGVEGFLAWAVADSQSWGVVHVVVHSLVLPWDEAVQRTEEEECLDWAAAQRHQVAVE